MENGIANFITQLFTYLSYGGIVVAMAIESCCIPLPSELIMPLAGALAFQQKFNIFGVYGSPTIQLWGSGAAGAVGCVVGSAVAYWIGATGGRPLLLRYGRYVLISHHDADRADAFFARYGELTIFATRLMPIVRTFISLPAGIARMNFGKFIAYTFLGSLPWCLALAYAGYKLGEHWGAVSGVLRKYDILVGISILALVALFLYRHLGRHKAAGRRQATGDRRQ
jgi:membrane protein DedA with SNARE-associated domain